LTYTKAASIHFRHDSCHHEVRRCLLAVIALNR
jgi:hypothetical protein